jgi:hypothetical protein
LDKTQPSPFAPESDEENVADDKKPTDEGRDLQLEKAVEVIMEELKKNPPPKLRRPAFPNYHPTTAQ